MSALDTIIRGGTVATASDTFQCDVGIRDDRLKRLADAGYNDTGWYGGYS